MRSRAPARSIPLRSGDNLPRPPNFPGIVGPISYEPGVRVPKKEVSVIEVADGEKSLRWVAPAR